MHWEFKPNDPQLLWRELVIQAQRIDFNGADLSCEQARWIPRATNWGYLFSNGFRRAPVGGRSAIPSPADFELKVTKKDPATAYSICPRNDLRPGTGGFPMDTWVVLQAPDTLALHLTPQVLLILARRPAGATPHASFACSKATTPTEKKICSDYALAAWDRSVAAAWRAAVDGSPEQEQRLRQEQKEWLRKRDACGANADCLRSEMAGRVSTLTRE
jgi:uncharacterized protein YecT (DUF1311 family)